MGDHREWSWEGEQQSTHPNVLSLEEFGMNQTFCFDPRLVRIEEDEVPHTQFDSPNVSIPIAPTNVSNDISDLPNVQNPAKRPRVSKRNYAIDSIHLSFLVASYHNHFNTYSNMRKKVADQLVPSAVWKSVYVDYCKEFPNSTFQEESLKVKLRETLKELKTGTSNEDNPEKATLQPIDFLTAIKVTKGHAKRNTLNLRAGIVDQFSCPSSQASGSSASKDSRLTTTTILLNEKEKDRPKSKGQILAETAEGITSLANTYAGGEANRNGLIKLKMESEKKRCCMFSTKDRSMRMNDLIKLRDEGFYTPEQFRREMQEILDSSS